ncbi:hypothetical protein LguiB_031636 [Lonicera macranthoides]
MAFKKRFDKMRHDIDVKLDVLETSPSGKSICKVPVKIRKLNKDCYSPRIISIGPIHKENPDLLITEDLKWTYAASFLQRGRDPTALDKCIIAILHRTSSACWCYSSVPITLDRHDLAMTFLVDGCFILELFLRKFEYREKRTGIENKDPILDDDSMLGNVQRDLALLENQIPLFVLQSLLKIIDPTKPPSWISDRTPYFFGLVSDSEQIETRLDISQEIVVEEKSSHLLEILHDYYGPMVDTVCSKIARSKKSGFLYSAIELSDGGLSFKRASSGGGFLNVVFDEQNKVLELPAFPLGEIENNLMRNFIAFEQCNFARTNHVIAYVKLLGSLICYTEDIKLLKKKQILQLESAYSENILSYFRSICAGIDQKDFYFSGLCEEVDVWGLKFSRSRYWSKFRQGKASIQLWWQKSVASLEANYFKDIWKIMSVIAATVLLLLTGLQTYYSVRSYYPH